MRGSRKIRFATIPMLAAIAAIAAGCGSSGDAASTTASTTTGTSAATSADAPAPLIQADAPCRGINDIGVDTTTGAAVLECAAGPDGPTWTDAPAVKIRAIGEPCEPKLEAVAWSTAGVELMCVDQEWVLTQ